MSVFSSNTSALPTIIIKISIFCAVSIITMSWTLIRHLGAAQNPPRTSHPLVKADAVASHLLQVARAPVNKKHKRRVQVEWQYFLGHAPDKRLYLQPSLWMNMKAGTAPGYDHVHPEFLKNLGLRAQTWLSRSFSRIIIVNAIPKPGERRR